MSSPHILVVDDEPDIRSLLKEILEDEGFDISVAENASDARDARRHRRPDLILLDIWMPDMDGFAPAVHCVQISNDGLVYICERGMNRVQVFTKQGEYVSEFMVAPNTPSRGPITLA